MCTPKPKGDISMANGKKYYFGWTGENRWKQGTEKAVCFTYAGGYTSLNDKTIWVPRSICITEPANEYGNFRIYIPCWFFKKSGYDHNRIREVDWGENGVSDLVTL